MPNRIKQAIDTGLGGMEATAQDAAAILAKARAEDRRAKRHFAPMGDALRVAAAVALAALVLCSGLLHPRAHVEKHQSEDGKRYIIQSVEPASSSVAEADPTQENFGQFSTQDFAEAVELLGRTPPMPQWIPEGWQVAQYTVGRLESMSFFSAAYLHEETGAFLSYTWEVYHKLNQYGLLEQDAPGTYIQLDNGANAYVTTNMGRPTIAWSDANTSALLSGAVDMDVLLKIAGSVE